MRVCGKDSDDVPTKVNNLPDSIKVSNIPESIKVSNFPDSIKVSRVDTVGNVSVVDLVSDVAVVDEVTNVASCLVAGAVAITGDVHVGNMPNHMDVDVANFPQTQMVRVTNWPDSSTPLMVDVTNWPDNPLTVDVNNWPQSTQTQITNWPDNTNPLPVKSTIAGCEVNLAPVFWMNEWGQTLVEPAGSPIIRPNDGTIALPAVLMHCLDTSRQIRQSYSNYTVMPVASSEKSGRSAIHSVGVTP